MPPNLGQDVSFFNARQTTILLVNANLSPNLLTDCSLLTTTIDVLGAVRVPRRCCRLNYDVLN